MPTASDQRVRDFIAALEELENRGDPAAMIGLFTADAELSSIALREPHRGAVKFWTEYRAVFKSVASRFNHIHSHGDLAVLEWISEGVLPNGTPISYQGVSILEYAGNRIGRFRTYYDSAAFLTEGAKLLGREIVS